ncbi:25807_t:CDS:1, partial [Dentiscutata erythropus]
NNDKAIPDVLDIESRLKPSIYGWMRYLRRLPKANVFGDIPKAQEKFIRKLDILGRVAGGTDESVDPDCFEENNINGDKECSEKINETKNRAIRAWNVLKGM